MHALTLANVATVLSYAHKNLSSLHFKTIKVCMNTKNLCFLIDFDNSIGRCLTIFLIGRFAPLPDGRRTNFVSWDRFYENSRHSCLDAVRRVWPNYCIGSYEFGHTLLCYLGWTSIFNKQRPVYWTYKSNLSEITQCDQIIALAVIKLVPLCSVT